MELALALDREGVRLQPSDSTDLLDETAWLQQLKHWLSSLCGDSSLDCPSLVRSAEELSLGLRFTDDATIADLNSSWRQKTGPTDVLSFAALDDAGDWMEGPSIELGDIVVSLETARRQAQEQGHSLQRELRWLMQQPWPILPRVLLLANWVQQPSVAQSSAGQFCLSRTQGGEL